MANNQNYIAQCESEWLWTLDNMRREIQGILSTLMSVNTFPPKICDKVLLNHDSVSVISLLVNCAIYFSSCKLFNINNQLRNTIHNSVTGDWWRCSEVLDSLARHALRFLLHPWQTWFLPNVHTGDLDQRQPVRCLWSPLNLPRHKIYCLVCLFSLDELDVAVTKAEIWCHIDVMALGTTQM